MKENFIILEREKNALENVPILLNCCDHNETKNPKSLNIDAGNL